MPAERFQIVSRRAARAKRLQVLQHVFAALLLMSAGWQHLKEGHASALPLLEIAAGALLIGAAVRERVRHARGGGHEAVGWVEIAGGVMTLVEAVAKTHERHHLSFLVLQFVQPAILFAFGFFDVRIASLHYLEAGDERLVHRSRIFMRRSVPWQGMRSFQFRGTRLEIATAGGVKALPLRDIQNLDAAQAWLREQFRRRAIREAPA